MALESRATAPLGASRRYRDDDDEADNRHPPLMTTVASILLFNRDFLLQNIFLTTLSQFVAPDVVRTNPRGSHDASHHRRESPAPWFVGTDE